MLFLYHYYRPAVLSAILLSLSLIGRTQYTGDYSMQFNNSSSPSGNTSFLNAAAAVSPTLYTGGLQISLPIYTMKGSDIQVPISIGYTASNGVRPSDPNTVVGMDWALLAGGSITRTVRGLPDESAYGYLGTNQEGATVVSDFNSPSSSTTQGFNNSYNQSVSKPIVDGEPDIFVINTPLFSAQFTIDPQTGNAVFIGGNNGLQVVHNLYQNSIGSPPSSITVIDAQGNQYIFGSKTQEMATTKFFGTSYPSYISTWYLDQIILLNSKDVVNFTYMTGKDDSVYSYALFCDYTDYYPTFYGFPPTSSITPNSELPGSDNRTLEFNLTVYNGPKFIQTISTKLGEADFAYVTPGNAYIYTGDPPELSTITIKQFNPITNTNSNVLETFDFSFTDIETGVTGLSSPFTGYWPAWDDYHRRLLSSISVIGNTAATSSPLTLYNLTYYQALPYPNRSVPEELDYWGFANNNTTNDQTLETLRYSYFYTPGQYRNTNSIAVSGQSQNIPMAALFALQQISNLTGASTTINYQQNDYYNGSTTQPAGGVRISSVVNQLPTGETLTTNYSYVDANGNSTGQLWSNLYSNVTMFFGSACCTIPALCYSQSPYGIADANGVMVGYSSVKVTNPNGGYTVNNFTNFSNYPDIITVPSSYAIYNTSSTYNTYVCEQLSSLAYKRGLPTTNTAYNANGNIVSQDINTYGSIGPTPVAAAIGMQDMTWWQNLSAGYSTSNVLGAVNIYHSNVENWRLIQTVHQDYDQVTPTSYLQTTTNYTYAPDNRQVRSISTTDSKGQNYTRTYYYSDDTNIPLATSSEQSTLAVLSASGTRTSPGINASGLLIHEIDSRNGTIHQKHYTYAATSLGVGTNYYLASDATYTGSTLESQNSYAYDPGTSQMISSQTVGDMSVSTMFAYNSSYPVVKIKNSSSSATYTVQQTTQTSYIQGVPGSITFTTAYAGSITLGEIAANGTGVNFNLTGGSEDVSNSMCYGTGCGVYQSTFPISNVPAGTYTLSVPTVSPTANGGGTTITCTYPAYSTSHTSTAEYFYEGFEQNTAATAGSAHTGAMYYNGNYSVPYTPPDSRTYLIQWWNLSGGQWIFNQQPYTANMTLTGPVDDIRVFPSDASMTTYTYSPLLGKTSETDPSGKSVIFEYDGLGRLQDTRDQNGNLLKQYNYQYQAGLSN